MRLCSAACARTSARTAPCSCGISTSRPGGIGRPGVNVSNTVSVEVSATFLSISFLTSALNGAPFSIERGDRLLAPRLARALVRFLVGDEIGRGEEAVLEVVDAEARGLRVGDRAEVPGHLHSARVRFVDRGGQLGARDLHVGLERRRAFVGPVGDLLARILGVLQRVHLHERVRPVQVRRGRIDRRTRLLPGSTSRFRLRSMKPFTLPPVLIVVTPPARYRRVKL